jgi:hypothetical protein
LPIVAAYECKDDGESWMDGVECWAGVIWCWSGEESGDTLARDERSEADDWIEWSWGGGKN